MFKVFFHKGYTYFLIYIPSILEFPDLPSLLGFLESQEIRTVLEHHLIRALLSVLWHQALQKQVHLSRPSYRVIQGNLWVQGFRANLDLQVTPAMVK